MIKLEITQKQLIEMIAEANNKGYDVLILEGVLQDEYLITSKFGYILIASEYVNEWNSKQLLILTPTNEQVIQFKMDYIEQLRVEEEEDSDYGY